MSRHAGCDHLLIPGNGTCLRCGLPASAETSWGDRITMVVLLAGLVVAWAHFAWRALS